MKVTLDITDEQIKGLLCSAFEGGSNYWCKIDDYEFCSGVTYEDFKDGGKFQVKGNYWHPSQIIPLTDGCNVVITDSEDNNKRYVLNLYTIEHGLLTFAHARNRHFGDFMVGDYDATTADAFLQCCLFGKIIYG